MADEQGGALAKKDPALAAAAVSAALGVAAYALRKASAGSGEGLSLHLRNGRDDEDARDGNARARNGSRVFTALESVSDSLLPLAEAATEEAGRWAATNAPALIRDRLLPRFIDAFRAAT